MSLNQRVENILAECDVRRDKMKVTKQHVKTLQGVVQKYQDDIDEKEHEAVMCEKTSELLKNISDTRNKVAKEKIEDVLNFALSNIPLEQTYKATLVETASKRSGKELEIILTDVETGYERSLKSQTGTWVKQLISFVLTMIVIKFSGASRIMVLDEVFSGIENHQMIKDFGKILTSLAKNEDFQIVMVEHGKELDEIEEIDNVFLGLNDYHKGTEIVG